MRSEKNIYNAAIYLRLSRDDGDGGESNSITNQRELIKNHIAADDTLQLAGEYVDDGYSGSNFDRPGFQQMMQDAQNKKINCIIVKDLSRLGRNYIETGRLIDQIFPMIGLRFISINDNFDSTKEWNDADQIIIPFKNLINDAYCRDISMKIRSQFDVRRKAGKFVGSFAAYGYRKDPNEKGHLLIDEKAADIVRMIFDMKMDGYNPGGIADKLNEMGVLTPLQYKRSVGLNCNSGYWRGEHPRWYHTTVRGILTNELYIGNMVQGKRQKINYKIKGSRAIRKEDWIRVPGTHEPIISREKFFRVQELLAMDTRTAPRNGRVEVLSGFLKCGDCGQNMVKRGNRRGDKVYEYYACSSYKAGKSCDSHMVSKTEVEQIVLQAIQKQCQLLLDVEKLLTELDDIPIESHRVKLITEQIVITQDELVKYNNLESKLYADLMAGVLEDEDYEQLKEQFTERIEELEDTKKSLTRKLEEYKKMPPIPPDWLEEIREFGEIDHLTRKLVAIMIDRILIYSKDRIEIRFRYGDEIENLLRAAQAGNENDTAEKVGENRNELRMLYKNDKLLSEGERYGASGY